LEVPTLHRILSVYLFPFSPAKYFGRELVESTTTHEKEVAMSEAKADELIDELFAIKRNFELDEIVIRKLKNKYWAHILQIKYGEYGKKITLGNRVNGQEDRELIPIIHKAQHGCAYSRRRTPKTMQNTVTIKVKLNSFFRGNVWVSHKSFLQKLNFYYTFILHEPNSFG
jgi:hypothetical protein